MDTYGLKLGHGSFRAERSTITVDQDFRDGVYSHQGKEEGIHGSNFNLFFQNDLCRVPPTRAADSASAMDAASAEIQPINRRFMI